MDRTRLKLGELKVESFEVMPARDAAPQQALMSCTGSPAICTACCVEPTCTDCPDC